MRKIYVIVSLMAAGIIAIESCTQKSQANDQATKNLDKATLVARGEYLVNAIGCDDCHSPKKMGPRGPEIIPELRFSGYPASRPIQIPDSNVVNQGWIMLGGDLTSAVGPWGMSFGANITSAESGIGNWTEENFIRSIRKGKFKGLEGSRDLLPPMPWFVYKNMTDDDIKSIFAYLQSTKPVENIVPAARSWADLK